MDDFSLKDLDFVMVVPDEDDDDCCNIVTPDGFEQSISIDNSVKAITEALGGIFLPREFDGKGAGLNLAYFSFFRPSATGPGSTAFLVDGLDTITRELYEIAAETGELGTATHTGHVNYLEFDSTIDEIEQAKRAATRNPHGPQPPAGKRLN